MAKLIYMMNTSLDGYIEDEHGNFGSGNTRIEHSFDPDAVRRLKANAAHDMAVSGPELAAHAIKAGLVDEIQLRICPVIVGGGKRFFPAGVRLDLEVLEERRFRCGDIFLRYAVRDQSRLVPSNTKMQCPSAGLGCLLLNQAVIAVVRRR